MLRCWPKFICMEGVTQALSDAEKGCNFAPLSADKKVSPAVLIYQYHPLEEVQAYMEVFGLDEWNSTYISCHSQMLQFRLQSDTAPRFSFSNCDNLDNCMWQHVHVLYLVSNSQIPPGSLGISGTLCACNAPTSSFLNLFCPAWRLMPCCGPAAAPGQA